MLVTPARPLLHELLIMQSNNGFLNRMLFIVSKPLKHKRAAVRAAVARINQYPSNVIVDTFKFIFYQPKDANITYTLSDEATAYVDELSDGYAENFNRLYNTTSGVFSR